MVSEDDEVTISFPVGFAVNGTPVSFQSGSTNSKQAWKDRVLEAARTVIPEHCWATDTQLSMTIYDFPTDQPEGDVDNIIKLIQDALNESVYIDDKQISRIVAQRFLPSECEMMEPLPDLVASALVHSPPFVYVHISNNPLSEAQ